MLETGFMDMVRELEAEVQGSRGGLVGHVEYLPSREAELADPVSELHPKVRQALRAKGIERMYRHQALAVDAALDGNNVAIATSTASGKSLCYNVPVLQTLLSERGKKALYLFPTKALGHDQKAGLDELMAGGEIDLSCDTYDGDTPKPDRRRVRDSADIIITNVDMLQYSVLPQHGVWQKFLSELAYVVIDEAHYYRGVFGSHVSMIIRRLRRVLSYLGVNPKFILCSATISNAKEHAEKLTGERFTLVDQDGSPSGGRAFMLMDSESLGMIYNSVQGVNVIAGRLTSDLMRRGVKTMTFAQNRQGVERIAQFTEDYLVGRRAGRNTRPDLRGKIGAYRAGYLAEDRRAIESQLRSGELLALAATNSMELGVDVGGVDATVLTGFPGTIASAWQQAGRSGRAGEQSLSVLLLRDNPVDQFYARYPEAFFGAASESAHVTLTNRFIVEAHLRCAAFELPLVEQDFEFLGDVQFIGLIADVMVGHGDFVRMRDGRYVLPRGSGNPCFSVNIRSSDNEKYQILDRRSGRKMEETTRMYALRELYPGAVYTHRGQMYRVVSFDERAREASLISMGNQRVYTQAVSETGVRILEEDGSVKSGELNFRFGKVLVTSRVIGFYERSFYSSDTVGQFTEVDMPAVELETTAMWLCDESGDLMREIRSLGALHAIGHVGASALAMLAMCDRRDVGSAVEVRHEQTGKPTAFIYEDDLGGIGLLEAVRSQPDAFVERMARIVSSCDCTEGCPSCVESAFCQEPDLMAPDKDRMLEYLGWTQVG